MTPATQLPTFGLLLLVLSLLSLTTAAATLSPPLHLLDARQSSSSANSPDCESYSRIANFSVVGANATYRAAYLAASPEGSDPARAPLDQAELQLPNLQFNATLNRECGNLTTIAFEGAESNFTNGIVLQFKVNAAGTLRAGAIGGMGMVVVAAMLTLTVGDLL
ncbi:hypothetical protein PV08_02839 [Exophiala spinifera]|uniref:ML-like domain-containing protein n=1 Tax=Exophiala spinifera TaxID=91928 RepID=A0A0D1YTK7_9EURO|nr:uncharacterized protein PV08_02839 [Exophiala spinifera]KIW18551.1 hypothetical protein PV08_02839 [Exophiala spinifera]